MASAEKLMIVVGARPQFVKAAAIYRALERAGAPRPELIHTGQHYDHGMSQVFFDEMEIPAPDVNLGVGSGPHGAMTGRMLDALEREMMARRPGLVLTFGDTNSTMAAALAAAKLHIPTAHVEAGLRSFNRAMPEEINRIVTDHVSDLLFCPSAPAREQLAKEGITRGVHVVGDVMFDTALYYKKKAIRPNRTGKFALATIHREENVENETRLRAILSALAALPISIVFPAHPRTKKRIERVGMNSFGAVELVDPLSYFDMLGHLEACEFVVTDSGGLQKEAYYFGKRCITVRDETEWTELVASGANRLTGADEKKITEALQWATQPMILSSQLYGSGDAADRIVRLLATPGSAEPQLGA